MSSILWLTWKDYTHPEAGGAEVVLRELSKRLIADGHKLTYLTVKYPGAAHREFLDGIDIIRVGTNRYLHPFQALWYYLRHLRGKFDIVIEVANTAPYFSVLFGGRGKKFLFYHQLARQIWYHETKFPLNHIGYFVLEPGANRILAASRTPTITVSQSTKKDLQKFGFKPKMTKIISEGIEITPIKALGKVKKYKKPTVLSLGSFRAMKRTLDQVKAFELAKQQIPNLRLKMVGDHSGDYGQKVLDYISNSQFANSIDVMGKVSTQKKIEVMQRSQLITVTSIKEGWGLIVTEAASQGTPAVVYNVDGLRDSVKNGKTGIVTNTNPLALAEGIFTMLQDHRKYAAMQKAAWQFSKQVNFEQSYSDFKKVVQVG